MGLYGLGECFRLARVGVGEDGTKEEEWDICVVKDCGRNRPETRAVMGIRDGIRWFPNSE